MASEAASGYRRQPDADGFEPEPTERWSPCETVPSTRCGPCVSTAPLLGERASVCGWMAPSRRDDDRAVHPRVKRAYVIVRARLGEFHFPARGGQELRVA